MKAFQDLFWNIIVKIWSLCYNFTSCTRMIQAAVTQLDFLFGGHAYNQDRPVKEWRELTTPKRSRFRRLARYQLCRLHSSQHFLLHCRFPTSPLATARINTTISVNHQVDHHNSGTWNDCSIGGIQRKFTYFSIPLTTFSSIWDRVTSKTRSKKISAKTKKTHESSKCSNSL